MRRLSRRPFARTRLKSITSLLVGVGLATGMVAAQGGSLLEPGTTTYLQDLFSDVPLEVGAAHTVILDTDDSAFFLLEAPLINHGTVRWAATGKFGEALAISGQAQINQGQWIVDNWIQMYLEGGLNNHGGVLQIGANSSVTSTSNSITGGRIHGVANTSNLNASSLKDVTITGQVNLVPWKHWKGASIPGAIGGKLTVDGTLGINAVNLSESTVLKGTGRTIFNNAVIDVASGVAAPQLTVEAGHTLSGTGRITNVALLNQGTLEINANERLQVDSTIVQEGDDARMVVKGELRAPEVQIRGGVIDLDGNSFVSGDVDVQKGRLVLHEIQFNDGAAAIPIINGDLTLSDQSEVEVIVGSDEQVSFIEIGGQASLDGHLIVSFAPGLTPRSTFEIGFLASSSVQGSFRSLQVNGAGNLPWVFVYQGNGGISVAAVPEPETWGMMMCGLGVVGWRLRRRAARQTAH